MNALGRRAPSVIAHRPMTVSDLDQVMAIETAAYPFPWSRGHFTDSLAAGYLAELRVFGRELLGYSVAMAGVEELHLLNITVAPAHQGQGHARALLARLGEVGRAQNAAQIWLEVRESNARARRLYEQWGFEAVGLRKGYYPAPHGEREHAVVMRWALDGGGIAGSGAGHDVD
ncbi:ribosomal protein S18-alanine N-acetyltransferase [Ideonella sp. DXS29W]|uniref:[Ribosomal protein bS18]-alanine N-acetyltransferase n=1 Tax=Ideonella lacteola TaxID=2984193 RepID=A0ABU9BVA8_9BURK